ncbi:MAG: beta-ketoacyl synthase N-terminal-like domain-containing protein [Candidatus Ozemobacteraceae bacterium]
MQRIVISGVGLVSSAGIGAEENEKRFRMRENGIQRITRFPLHPKVKTCIAGLISPVPAERLPADILPQLGEEDLQQDYVKAAIYVVDEALRDAGIREKIRENPRRTALIVASSLGNFLYVSELVKEYYMKEKYRISSLIHGMNSYMPSRLASLFGVKGPCFFVSSSCTSALNAVLQGDSLIQRGVVDRAIICAVDVCLETGTYHLWNKLRVLSHRNDDPNTACRPYCKTRDGMVVSEAAACFILEKEVPDQKAYARIRGYGMSNGSPDFLKPTPKDLLTAIREAMAEAKMEPRNIDFIAGSASGSPYCDHFETEAIREVFGDYTDRIPLFSFKSFLGTTFGTQAISEGTLGLRCMQSHHLPEVRNVFEHDERVKANAYYRREDYIGMRMNRFLFINSGFAGNHMAIVFERPEVGEIL